MVLEKTLESPLDCRRSNQSILKEISPEYSLYGLMLKLKLQYFSHLMQRTDSFDKTLMLGKIESGRRRIDAFEVWCLRRLLRVPWTARRPNQSILKEISPEYSLEGLMMELKLQYFGHLMRRADSFENTLILERLKAGGEGDDRGRKCWMTSVTQWT